MAFAREWGGGEGGQRVFAWDKKYFRHVSEGFCKRSKGGLEEFWRGYEAFTRVGVWKSLWAFAWVIKYHKHIWEGFCKTRTRALSQGLQIIWYIYPIAFARSKGDERRPRWCGGRPVGFGMGQEIF